MLPGGWLFPGMDPTDEVSYNSCRNRHCPKCQASAAQRWLEARQADLLPVEYYLVVFTLPAPIAEIWYQNKAAIYGLLANGARTANLARARELLSVEPLDTSAAHDTDQARPPTFVCPHCGHAMLIVQALPRVQVIRAAPPPPRPLPRI